jgi:hypothetical protein
MDYYTMGYIDRDIQRLKEESEYRQRFWFNLEFA